MRSDSARPQAFVALCILVSVSASTTRAVADDETEMRALANAYAFEIRPSFVRYCQKCHSEDRTEADVDLGAFVSLADIRKQPKIWQKVDHMLDTRQMPPKKARQPSDAERTRLSRWVRKYLTAEARASAGDPGPVVLRRLSNAEYTYTVRDLTGVDSLDPTREFPIDGAAGEGFTNTGSALVMSPSLVTKYLDAAKKIARHAVLFPDGIRFSSAATRRDWTDKQLSGLREFYAEYSGSGGGASVVRQGITLDVNRGGRLDLEKFLAATLVEREALQSGTKTTEQVARECGLNAKYLGTLWRAMTAKTSSTLLESVRVRWKDAKPGDAKALASEIDSWQKALWKFNSIGHIGKQGGPKSWMEAVTPITTRQEFRIKLPEPGGGEDVVIYLAASSVTDGKKGGDGKVGDYVVWKSPRLEGGGQPVLPLRDLAGLQQRLAERRQEVLSKTTKYLAACAEADTEPDVEALASKHGLNVELLEVWLEYLDLGDPRPVKVTGHFTAKMLKGGNYDFIQGWGTRATPSVSANSSDQQVRIPGIARPRSVVAHPSPTLFSAMGWHSPLDAVVRVEARVADAHPECGNGVEWVVQHRSGKKVGKLWQGDFAVRGSAQMPPTTISVRRGDLVSFVLGPREGIHSCDLTQVDLVITETGGAQRVWDLAKDVSADILASNPHADSHGNPTTWHFYKGEMKTVHSGGGPLVSVPAGSVLAAWQAETDAGKQRAIAERIQALVAGEPPTEDGVPDAVVYQQLRALAAPALDASILKDLESDKRFGKHPVGDVSVSGTIDAADLIVAAPVVVEFRIPGSLAAGRELVVSAEVDSEHGREAIVQLEASLTRPALADSLRPERPVVVRDGSQADKLLRRAFDDFRELFPAALCYARIVPVDEVVTLTLFHREDEPLRRLMLEDDEASQLDRLWDELYFVSQEPLLLVTAYEQISQFATQDRPDLVIAFEPMRAPIAKRAEAFRKRLVATEPSHVDAVLEIAGRAWRRSLTVDERQGLRDLYRKLREGEIPHDDAIRLTLARILTSPSFLYRLESPGPGEKATSVSSIELASRLSYFLGSSMPDDELRRVAEAGELTNEKVLLAQTRRLLSSARTRRLAIQFACQWLHIRGFDQNDEKNEKLYPEFATLRVEMYEESVRFFEDMFRNDGSVLGMLNADHTFLNESLATHNGIGGVQGAEWRRVDGVRGKGRGGILAMATVLASQSGASRTSPILRGNWVSETLLGERLPRPPPNVPQLPDAVPSGRTARELIEAHSSVPECAKCHARIDPYGFALEQYDAIGRLRADIVDTRTQLVDGKAIEGIEGLRAYLAKDRHDDFLQQFCRKLLGYALGRAVQLSDEPLLAELRRRLETNGYRFSVAVEAIVTSRQFREIRGAATSEE
jgi:hypothetical protein